MSAIQNYRQNKIFVQLLHNLTPKFGPKNVTKRRKLATRTGNKVLETNRFFDGQS